MARRRDFCEAIFGISYAAAEIRAVLGLERELSPHLYRNDLRAVLVRGGGCRSHIRSAALRWLTTFPPHLWEYELVAGIAADEGDPLAPQARQTLVSSGFVPHFLDHGLASGHAALNPGSVLASVFGQDQVQWMLAEAARVSPEEICAGLLPVARDPDAAVSWVGVLLWAVFLSGPKAAKATVDLYCATAATIADRLATAVTAALAEGEQVPDALVQAGNRLFSVDGVHALSTLVKHDNAPAAAALRAWLGARAKVASAMGARNAFDPASRLPREGTGLKIFHRAAERDPLLFLGELNGRLLVEFAQLRFEVPWRPSGADEARPGLRWDGMIGSGGEWPDLAGEVINGWRAALALGAARHPEEAAGYLEQLTATDQRLAHELAASAFSRCAPELHARALAWALSGTAESADDGVVERVDGVRVLGRS